MAHRPSLLLSRRTVRRALGGLWLLDAALQAQPVMFGADWWRTDLAGSAMGEPAPLAHLILWATDLVSTHAAMWNLFFVVVQALLGLSLLVGRWERGAIVASLPWAIGVWIVGEGMGMLPTGFATLATGAPGPVLLYPLIGILAWPGRERRRSMLAAWVVLWAGLAVLQFPFVFSSRQVLTANVQELSQGLPHWQTAVAGGMSALVSTHAVAVSAGMAIVQVAVGVGVLSPSWRRPALATGVFVALGYWVGFQFLGGLLAGGATDPGAAPLMVLLAIALWPAGRTASARLPRPFVHEELPALAVP